MNTVDEYLRRNLQHARSIGVCADLKVAIDRLVKCKHPPKWLMRRLVDALGRASELPRELAAHRNEVKL